MKYQWDDAISLNQYLLIYQPIKALMNQYQCQQLFFLSKNFFFFSGSLSNRSFFFFSILLISSLGRKSFFIPCSIAKLYICCMVIIIKIKIIILIVFLA